MIDVIIEKLTESIEDAKSGRRYDTQVRRASEEDLQQLSSRWLFDWYAEVAVHEVYKLTIPGISSTIQGLISWERQAGFVFVHLVESNPQNVGRKKRYVGVAGNLMAHACQISFALGFEGVVAFDAKTELIRHYETTLGAHRISDQRMALDPAASAALVAQYFGGKHGTDS